jgi:hypothetical protein
MREMRDLLLPQLVAAEQAGCFNNGEMIYPQSENPEQHQLLAASSFPTVLASVSSSASSQGSSSALDLDSSTAATSSPPSSFTTHDFIAAAHPADVLSPVAEIASDYDISMKDHAEVLCFCKAYPFTTPHLSGVFRIFSC